MNTTTNRGDLTEVQWVRFLPHLPARKPPTGHPANDHRPILTGSLWTNRTGAPWRALPACYGPVGTVSSRFYRWRQAGIWGSLSISVLRGAIARQQHPQAKVRVIAEPKGPPFHQLDLVVQPLDQPTRRAPHEVVEDRFLPAGDK